MEALSLTSVSNHPPHGLVSKAYLTKGLRWDRGTQLALACTLTHICNVHQHRDIHVARRLPRVLGEKSAPKTQGQGPQCKHLPPPVFSINSLVMRTQASQLTFLPSFLLLLDLLSGQRTTDSAPPDLRGAGRLALASQSSPSLGCCLSELLFINP